MNTGIHALTEKTLQITDQCYLVKWRSSRQLTFTYPVWAYECCGTPIHVGDYIDDWYISDTEDPNCPLYSDEHCNIGYDPEQSFYAEGYVKRLQARCVHIETKQTILLDISSTETAFSELFRIQHPSLGVTDFVITLEKFLIEPVVDEDESS